MGIHSMGRSSMMQKTSSNRTLLKKSEDKRLVKRSVSYATNYSGPGSYEKVQGRTVEHTPSDDAIRRDWHQRAVAHTHAHTHRRPLSDEAGTHATSNRRHSETRGILNRFGGQRAHTHEHTDYSYGGVDINDDGEDDGFQLSDYAVTPVNNLPSSAPILTASKAIASKETHSNSKHSINSKNGKEEEEIDSYQSGAEGFRITKSTSVLNLFESVADTPNTMPEGGEVCDQSKLIKFTSF